MILQIPPFFFSNIAGSLKWISLEVHLNIWPGLVYKFQNIFVTHNEIVWIANIWQKVWMSGNQSDGRAAGLAQVAQGNDDDCGVGQHRANVHSQLSLIIPD